MWAAHLAHLVLNWNEDSFVFRQRVNCDSRKLGTDGRKAHKPPHALPAVFGRSIKYTRLVLSLCVLILELAKCAVEESNREKNVSYEAHAYGAASGVIFGYIFLKDRHSNFAERKLKYCLLACIIGIVPLYCVITRKIDNNAHIQMLCPWYEYEDICHEICYHGKKNFELGAFPKCNETFKIPC